MRGISILPQIPVANNRINTVIAVVTAVLVALVALGSFALSYNALQDMAVKHGITGWQSYIWPLLIDFSLIVFSLAVVTAYLQSESTLRQWLLVGIYTTATISFNVAHAPNNFQAQIMAAIAPLSLFFSFELLMSQLKTSVKKHGITVSLSQMSQEYQDKVRQVSSLNDEIDSLVAQIHSLTMQAKAESVTDGANDTSLDQANEVRQNQIAQRRQQVLTLVKQSVSYSDIASQLGVSLATVKRDIASLNGKVQK